MTTQQPEGEVKRKITIEFEIDWQDYDDVIDELVVEDMFEQCHMKEGVSYSIVESSQQTAALVDALEEATNELSYSLDGEYTSGESNERVKKFRALIAKHRKV